MYQKDNIAPTQKPSQPVIARLADHQDNQNKQVNQLSTFAERRKFWINMALDAFMKLCRQQELLKSSKNECYEVAFTLFSIVHNDQSGPIELVLPYLNRLEELRNAKIVVSADKFLEARQRGRIPELP